MAERRMFSKTIIDSDDFLGMPQSSQALYFHLAMRADDDGFINNSRAIAGMAGCKEDDIKTLIAKRYIISFDSGVIAVTHWNVHNCIQKDRYHETKYKAEKAMLGLDENNAYMLLDTNCIQSVSITETQVSVGKDSIGKERKKSSSGKTQAFPPDSDPYILANFLRERIFDTNPKHKPIDEATVQRWAKDMDLMLRIDERDKHEIVSVINFAQDSPFWCANILSAGKLREKYDTLMMQRARDERDD